ncbi:NfeD family protein [Geotalea sp. SG265]|uniref:NfeD family protein n=1 Tax=Geotalea sp. SG265 TaxID=2922867 RepID=UPI001FAEC79C|nr:NfeD family protein [Geotalea sp. SG265]
MDILWWHWLVLGLILIGLELVVPSFTIIWFGLGAVLVSILLALFPACPLPLQIFAWCVASILFTFVWFRFFNPRNKSRTFSGTAKDAVLGQTGLVIRGAEPYAKGAVKFQLPLLGADEWPCLADEPLEIGDRVKVVDVEGHVMKVEKLKKGES